MRLPWQDDKEPKDGKPDDYPFDTYMEIFVAWIAICLTSLVIMGVLYFVQNSAN